MSRKAKRQTLPKENKEFSEEVIQIDRVTRVVKGGRRLRFRATVVIGDRAGRVGVGTGKSNEVTTAISKAISKAKKSIITVPLVNDTIPHDIHHKFKAANIMLMPAGPGTGIIAGGAVRKVVDMAGIKNILSKSHGSSNKLSCAQAAYQALSLLKENPFVKVLKKEEPKTVVEKPEAEEATVEKKVEAKKPAAKKPAAKKAAKEAPKAAKTESEPKAE